MPMNFNYLAHYSLIISHVNFLDTEKGNKEQERYEK